MKATILKPGATADAPVMNMLNFLRGGVVSGHVFVSGGEHDHDATGLKKFENVSSPERYNPTTTASSPYVLPDVQPYAHRLPARRCAPCGSSGAR